MNNRINVYEEGSAGLYVVGQAVAENGMVVRFHAKSGGSSDAEAELEANQTDSLVISAVDNDVITAVSETSSKTYKEYAHNTYVKSNDTVLNDGDNWPDDTNHFAFA